MCFENIDIISHARVGYLLFVTKIYTFIKNRLLNIKLHESTFVMTTLLKSTLNFMQIAPLCPPSPKSQSMIGENEMNTISRNRLDRIVRFQMEYRAIFSLGYPTDLLQTILVYIVHCTRVQDQSLCTLQCFK